MNINRDYLIINDVKKSNVKLDNGSMFFYITDKNTQNIFVNLVINVSKNDLIQKYANIENAEDYTLTMNIVKPDNTYKIIEGKLHDKEKAIFEFDLKEDCVDKIGTYKCELLTKCNINDHEEITTSNKLTYKVKSSILNNLDDIVNAPEYPLVIQLFDKLSDIEQYEEDRRANELARQLAEGQRQTRFEALDSDMVDRVNAMDSKMDDVEARISAKEQAVDKLIVDTKKDIDDYKVAKDTEIDEYKTAKDQQIDQAIADQNNKIDDAIANQNNKIDTAIAEQNNRIGIVEASDNTQNTRLDALEAKDIAHETSITNIEAKNVEQDNRLDSIENINQQQAGRLDSIEQVNTTQNNRLDSIEAVNVSQDNRLDAIEIKNQQQDDRLLDVEKVNKRQDMNLKCLFAESKNNMIDVTEEGNSIYLQNSTVGYTLIDEIQGNTMVNCNKEADKEIILNGNINTSGDKAVTITEGVDGGLVDVALEGNTMVNVCDQKDPVAITKNYTVETGNHVALQGEYDGKCRPVLNGNTLVNLSSIGKTVLSSGGNNKATTCEMIKPNTTYTTIINIKSNTLSPSNTSGNVGAIDVNNGTASTNIASGQTGIIKKVFTTNEDISSYTYIERVRVHSITTEGSIEIEAMLLEGDYTNKPTPEYFDGLQSSFEDKVVTQEMVDAGEEIAENLGKYKVDYVISKEDGTIGQTKTFYINNPLLEGDTIEQSGNNVVHVHRSEIRAYETDDELTLPTDMTNTLVAKATPQYEVISQNDTILCDSYTNGHLDVDSVVPIEKVVFIETPRMTLKYLYPSINYIVQFEADNVGSATIVLGGKNIGTQTIAKGINKFNATTNETPNNQLKIGGIGFNASNIVVTEATDQDFGYFEGMKSVGECEDLEVVSSNKNLFDINIFNDGNNFKPCRGAMSWGYYPIFIGIGNKAYLKRKYKDNVTNYPMCLLCNDKHEGMNKTWIPISHTSYRDTNYSGNISADSNGYVYVLITLSNISQYKNVLDEVIVSIIDSDYVPHTSNTQTLTHEPLRAVGDVKDKYVLIDGKWYIERNCKCIQSKDLKFTSENIYLSTDFPDVVGFRLMNTGISSPMICDNYVYSSNRIINIGKLITNKEGINIIGAEFFITVKKSKLETLTHEGLTNYLSNNSFKIITCADSPTYEPIDYNPLEVYSDITHITNNSTIPANMTIKNTGYNCLLKPSTTYTVSSNLGLNTVTTPSTLTEDCLRFYDTDTSTVTKMKDVMVLEGDYTTNGKPMPSHFSGIESCFEQEYDEAVGKYKVKIRVQNEDVSRENYIEFYINEPLRGIGEVKDRVYVKNDKVVVERKCGQREYQDRDFGTYLTDKVNTVYQLAEPTYEEVEYNDTKLFIESFKNSTLFYNSNVPVTSKLYYSYSVPIVDTVSQTANVTDQQDSMIIDLATQCAVMEMYLM